MKPHEFWELTPIEALDYAEAVTEGASFQAWLAAAYQRADKFPKRPEDIFRKEGAGGMDILSQAKKMKMFQESDARLAVRRRKKPTTTIKEG